MRELHKAHQEFKKEWKDWRNGNVKSTEKKKQKKLKGQEPETVTIARDKFIRTVKNAKKFFLFSHS